MTTTADDRAGSGIARSLAARRSASVRSLRYALALDLPASPEAAIEGRVSIALETEPGAERPELDFAPDPDDRVAAGQVRAARINGIEVPFSLENGHIRIDADRPSATERIEIDFVAGSAGLTRRSELVYSLFVPAKAHSVFPCFDQPDLKAPLELVLGLPAEWEALANAPLIARRVDGGRARLHFAPTEPLPTYLFAWVAGALRAEERTIDGRRLRLVHREPDQAALGRNRSEIFTLHARALAALEEYTGIPYPFAQFAFALIPDFEFGGMEHPGAIFYRRGLMLLGADAGEAARLRRANLIAHETAHIWFGDLVTMPWFDDVWLKEAFASFMADKVTQRVFPRADHRLRFVLQHYPAAYGIDRTPGTHPIRQTLENLSEAGELYDALIYHKAPIALEALEREIGEDALRRGVRAYLGDFRFAHADWPALVARLEPETSRGLTAWSRDWIETAGPPALPGPIDWDAPYYGQLALDAAGRSAALDILESGQEPASDGNRAACGPIRRAAAWLALHEDLQGGGIEPSRLLAAGIAALSCEPEPLLAARIANDAAEIYWRHLTSLERAAAAAPIERALRARIEDADDPGQALSWLKALAAVAQTPETIADIEAAWRNRAIGGLPLPEPLAVELCLTLAAHRPECAAELISAQAERTRDPDRRARLEFLRPALAADRGERDAFFARIVSSAGRGLWTVAGVGWLNHPLRADEALHYLEPGLLHAARIRQRGDIFLPRQWLEALFRGHGTASAAERVAVFMATTGASFAPRLKQLVWQTADPVFRAAAGKTKKKGV